jgi:hypothetical protein
VGFDARIFRSCHRNFAVNSGFLGGVDVVGLNS